MGKDPYMFDYTDHIVDSLRKKGKLFHNPEKHCNICHYQYQNMTSFYVNVPDEGEIRIVICRKCEDSL